MNQWKHLGPIAKPVFEELSGYKWDETLFVQQLYIRTYNLYNGLEDDTVLDYSYSYDIFLLLNCLLSEKFHLNPYEEIEAGYRVEFPDKPPSSYRDLIQAGRTKNH